MKQIQLNIDGKDAIFDISEIENKRYVSINSVCEAIGIDAKAQRTKLAHNQRFHPKVIVWIGEMQGDLLMLPVEEVCLWLCSISTSRMPEPLKATLLAFKKECQLKLSFAVTCSVGIAEIARLESHSSVLMEQLKKTVDQLTTSTTQMAASTAQMEEMMDLITTQQNVIADLTRKIQGLPEQSELQ